MPHHFDEHRLVAMHSHIHSVSGVHIKLGLHKRAAHEEQCVVRLLCECEAVIDSSALTVAQTVRATPL